MRIDIIDTPTAYQAVRDNWDEVFLDDPHAQHFLSWIWLKNYLSRRKRWFVLALRERAEGSPYVAFFPLRMVTEQDKKTGMFSDDIIMAGNFAADYTGFIAQPAYEQHAIAGFSAYLKAQRWTQLKLEYFSGPPERHQAMIRALRGPDVMFRDSTPQNPYNIDNCICPVVSLPSSWDDYLEQKMSSQSRQKLRRFLRKIETGDTYRITLANSETIDRDMDILFDLWRIRWAPHKGKDRTEKLIAATRDMLMDCFHAGNLDVPVLWYGKQPLGALANIVDRQKMAILFYVTGRDENWKTPSPGLILHGFCIRRAIEAGFKHYDFLRGNEAYKFMFGVEERRISCTLFRTRTGLNLGGALNPRSIRFVYEQALRLYRTGAKAQAETAFRQVLQAAPDHDGACFGLANLLFEKGRLLEAREAYTGLAQRVENPIPVYLRLGETLLALQRYDEAAETFHRVVERAPYHREALYKYAIALMAAGRQPQAVKTLTTLQAYHSDDPAHLQYAEKAKAALTRITASLSCDGATSSSTTVFARSRVVRRKTWTPPVVLH